MMILTVASLAFVLAVGALLAAALVNSWSEARWGYCRLHVEALEREMTALKGQPTSPPTSPITN